MEPYGIAVAADGTVFVSDPQAQNIRAIGLDGLVRVVAGPLQYPLGTRWVAGTFADGVASSALFNQPEGLAVAADGSLLIADRGGGCIRKLSAGVVSTFAGKCNSRGTVDGPVASARFAAPTALAFDREGDLFVAQDQADVRKIDANGNVTTLHLELANDDRVMGISVGAGKGPSSQESLFIVDRAGILRYDLRTAKTLRLAASIDSQSLSNVEGNSQIGFPYSIVALNDRDAVYSDARTNTVRYLHDLASNVIAGAPVHDAGSLSAGYVDGVGTLAKFNAPTGIAVAADGQTLYVADAANRRIRKIDGVDTRGNVLPSLSGLAAYRAPHPLRSIAIVGNSQAWDDTMYPDSIEGKLQQYLCAGDSHECVVIPFSFAGASFNSIGQFIAESIPDLGVQHVVLQVTSQFVTNYDAEEVSDAFSDSAAFLAYSQTLARIKHVLSQSGIAFTFVFTPQAYDLSPTQGFEFQNGAKHYYRYNGPDADRLHRKMLDVARSLGISVVDVWPAFLASLDQHPEIALFHTDDPHLSAAGRALVAKVLAKALQ